MEITEQRIKELFDEFIANYASKNQYTVSKVPAHTHNGSDALPLQLQYFEQLGASKQVYFIKEIDNGKSGTSLNINWTSGNKQKITTTGNCTLTFVDPTGPCNLILRIVHEASSSMYAYTYPSTVKWNGGTKPVTTNTSGSVDIITFYFDGTNYWGAGLLNFS